MSHAYALESLHDLEPTVAEFRAAVLQGLGGTPKTLPCKFFYDAEGSRLFDRICELPEYYPTRTECALLEARAPEIAALVGPHAGLVEFGSGAGVKVRLLLAALRFPAVYVPAGTFWRQRPAWRPISLACGSLRSAPTTPTASPCPGWPAVRPGALPGSSLAPLSATSPHPRRLASSGVRANCWDAAR